MALDRTSTNIGYLVGRCIGACRRAAEALSAPTSHISDALEIAPRDPMRGLQLAMETAMHAGALHPARPAGYQELEEQICLIADKLPADLPDRKLTENERMVIVLGYDHQLGAYPI